MPLWNFLCEKACFAPCHWMFCNYFFCLFHCRRTSDKLESKYCQLISTKVRILRCMAFLLQIFLHNWQLVSNFKWEGMPLWRYLIFDIWYNIFLFPSPDQWTNCSSNTESSKCISANHKRGFFICTKNAQIYIDWWSHHLLWNWNWNYSFSQVGMFSMFS